MRVAIIIVLAIVLVAGVTPLSGAAHGQNKRRQTKYDLYFPNVSVPRDAGISSVRIVVTCGHVVAVTRIPDDWYVRTLLPAHESEPEWEEFRLAWSAVDFEAGHGVTRLRNLKALDGATRIAVEDARCFDVVADIKDDMTENGWKTRLRKPQLQLRTQHSFLALPSTSVDASRDSVLLKMLFDSKLAPPHGRVGSTVGLRK